MPREKSSTVASVLLKPTDGDPHGLLARGLCGSCPPYAWRLEGAKWNAGQGTGPVLTDGDALVLAWEGAPVPEGSDRAARCADVVPSALLNRILSVLEGYPMPRAVADLGTLLYLDAEGREVTP